MLIAYLTSCCLDFTLNSLCPQQKEQSGKRQAPSGACSRDMSQPLAKWSGQEVAAPNALLEVEQAQKRCCPGSWRHCTELGSSGKSLCMARSGFFPSKTAPDLGLDCMMARTNFTHTHTHTHTHIVAPSLSFGIWDLVP